MSDNTPDNTTSQDAPRGRKIHRDGSELGHVWERAQLGEAPFKFVKMIERAYSPVPEINMPGGTCDYCGTCIRYCYVIRSADGKQFEVGSDCVAHLDDERLVAVVMSEERRRKNALAAKRRDERRRAERATQNAERDARMPEYAAALAVLESLPHPNEYFAGQGKTRADYYRYFEREGRPDYWKQRAAIDDAAAVDDGQALARALESAASAAPVERAAVAADEDTEEIPF